LTPDPSIEHGPDQPSTPQFSEIQLDVTLQTLLLQVAICQTFPNYIHYAPFVSLALYFNILFSHYSLHTRKHLGNWHSVNICWKKSLKSISSRSSALKRSTRKRY